MTILIKSAAKLHFFFDIYNIFRIFFHKNLVMSIFLLNFALNLDAKYCYLHHI